MNLGMSSALAGLSASYPAYVQGRMQENLADTSDIGLQDLKRTQAARAAMGNALQLLAGGGQGNVVPPMPQQMAPGQPSQSMQQPGMGGPPPMPLGGGAPQMGGPGPQQQPMMRPPMPQGGGGPMMAPQPMPGGGQMRPQQGGMGQGALDWRQLITAVRQANPNIAPDVLAEAVNQFMPLMNQQSQMEWKQISLQLAAQRTAQGQERVEQGQQRVDQSGQRVEQSEQRLDLAKQREQRLTVAQQIREDRQYKQLELQTQELARKVTQGGERNQLATWRAKVDAQHKRAMEIIAANSSGSGMSAADRKTLVEEENAFYKTQLDEMRDAVGSATPRGTSAKPGAEKIQERAPAGGGPGAPKAGDVIDGYKFKGGDPAQKENWEKVSG